MAYVLGKIFNWLQNSSSNTEFDAGFTASPLFVVLVLSCYLYFVKKCGPEFMKNREPYELRAVMLVYNAVQVVFNIWLFILCLRALLIQTNGNFLACLVTDQLSFNCAYYYLLNKYVDLLETFIFVFRKKNRQISFLHVYHHCLVISASCLGLTVAPGGMTLMIGILNCLVHAVMYVYYFVTIYDKENIQKYGSFKKNLTQMQLAQFVILAVHFMRSTVGICSYSSTVSTIAFLQNIFLIALFGDFYIRTYVKK